MTSLLSWIPPELAIYGAILLLTVGILAYLLKKYNELAKQILEEKLAILDPTIKLIEQILPSVPDQYKGYLTEFLAYLKWLKAVNEALLGTSPTKLYSTWARYKSRMPTEVTALKGVKAE